MNIFFGFLILFWLVVFTRRVSYYLYFWQVKEYRIDRMLAQLTEFGHGFPVFTKSFYIKALAVFIFSISGSFWSSVVIILTLLYLLESLLIFYRIFQNEIRFPIITFKSSSIFLLSLLTPVILLSPLIVDKQLIAFFLLGTDIIAPLIVSFWVLFFKPITYVAKQIIVMRAKRKREKMKNLTAIGITGSFGKTSTKEFLAHILASRFKVAHTREHQNTEVGAARAILGMGEDTQILVAEMAAYHQGDIKEISQVVKPTIGIITAIGPQHLALFGSIEAIIDTKFELAQVLPKKGVLIVNWDNEQIKSKVKSQKSKLNVLKYSLADKKADVYAQEIEERVDGLTFTVHYKKEKERVSVNLLGKHNVLNILAAATAALMLGMSLREISEAVLSIQQVPHTMRLHWLPGNIPLIDDSYNASVDGVKAALAYLKNWQDKKRIFVMPSLIELGDKAFILHEELGLEIAKTCDFAFITDSKYKEALWRGWKSVRGDDSNLHFHQNPQNLIQELKQTIDENSVILIEGRVPKEITDFLLHR